MSDFYRQQSSKNNDDYNPFQDEKLPWERAEVPQQAQNTSPKYMNHSERPRTNAAVQHTSNKPWEMASNNSPF
mgnify:FL=1